MEIRVATAADAVTIAGLLDHLGYPADAAAIPARLGAIAAAGGVVLLAWAEGGVAAGLVGLQAFPVLHASSPVAYITALVVAPSARGQGVGRALVAAAETWARAAGCSRLTVTSAAHRDGAHAFYPQVGLPYTGRRYSRVLDEPASRPGTRRGVVAEPGARVRPATVPEPSVATPSPPTDRTSSAEHATAPCPTCGARLGGRAGCQESFDALLAGSWEEPRRGAVHNLAVDAYCLQHPDDYCASAKSYAAHLAGLCCGVEHGGDPHRYRAIPRWLDGHRRDLIRPDGPTARGAATIADVCDVPDPEAYAAAVRAWADSVWRAHAAQHALARAWLQAATAPGRRLGPSLGRRER